MRRVMQRVADRASKADVKVMALLIREKLSASHGAHHWRAGQKISTELEVLPAELAAATHELRQCRCAMRRGMNCKCSLAVSAAAAKPEGPSAQARANASSVGSRATSGGSEQGGSGSSFGSRRRARRKYGSVVLSPMQVAAKVKEMGGVDAVEGQQGRKGGGWKTVGAALGVDVINFRDCGFHVSSSRSALVLPDRVACIPAVRAARAFPRAVHPLSHGWLQVKGALTCGRCGVRVSAAAKTLLGGRARQRGVRPRV